MKLAVFDFGTRASRMLIGNIEEVKEHGFDFDYFKNVGELTELGNGLIEIDKNIYELRIKYLDKTVSFIRRYLKMAKKENIEFKNIIAVGTEVFRRANNTIQIIDTIKQATNLKINVLSPIEEAKTSFYAVAASFSEENMGKGPFAVIEQGGGSIQITVGEIKYDGSIDTLAQTSIGELGTLLLRKKFIDFSNDRQHVKTVKKIVYDYATSTINKVLKEKFLLKLDNNINRAYGIGTGVTTFYKGSNRKIHGKVIMNSELYNSTNSFLDNYNNYAVKSLIKDARDLQIPGEDEASVYKKLESYYSLPCYKAVLDYFKISDLKICGTGLRYGVFFRKIYNEWNDIEIYNG
jgi:exopolyphosphatase/pppGpp-phosphohydrolase